MRASSRRAAAARVCAPARARCAAWRCAAPAKALPARVLRARQRSALQAHACVRTHVLAQPGRYARASGTCCAPLKALASGARARRCCCRRTLYAGGYASGMVATRYARAARVAQQKLLQDGCRRQTTAHIMAAGATARRGVSRVMRENANSAALQRYARADAATHGKGAIPAEGMLRGARGAVSLRRAARCAQVALPLTPPVMLRTVAPAPPSQRCARAATAPRRRCRACSACRTPAGARHAASC